ncbi:hypothetical protein T8K17_22830 [Thalassobaculum sp. OXR-137]|uniref:hypothetical protein n=1 Tax=Thalassobaculum sp. OXR-137 TaxID=3100173 RepID=UPI002AC8F5A1|nr:hypothetical protein [Thalassobaculum sp. OXR-137]WPZ34060.1 hypothetical protein T8K17_22830 [Thalassobaculum sp. OXR-137]
MKMVWRSVILASLFSVAIVASVSAQSKFFATSSRGIEGGKANAQIGTLQGENDRMNACTAAGRIYAPTNAGADAGGCVTSFTIDTATGNLTVTGTGIFDNGATVNNGLNVPSGNVNVGNRVTAAELFVGAGNVGTIPTCTGANKIQWNGTSWVCVADEIGATAATETDPQVGGLTNGRWCRTNGSQIICDVNVPLACGTSQKLIWNGTSWTCQADQGLVSESDPQVGSLTSGKWCTTDGATINCTSDAPTGTTTTTTSGASCVSCNSVCSCGGSTVSCYQCNCDQCSGGDGGDW